MVETTNRDRRAERREATKAEIVDAAWELARAEGLGAISLRDIARAVGMQAPSLYGYFASKHDDLRRHVRRGGTASSSTREPRGPS